MKEDLKIEERLIFMGILTFVGGFLNAYAFFVRGGAFVSLHTGNMVKVGISIYEKDSMLFYSAIVPIIGCLIGAIIAQLLKNFLKEKKSIEIFKFLIIFEAILLFLVGIVPTTFSNNIVNFVLSIVTTFQLSNFRKYRGAVHNTTIMTGNLRTLGGYIGDILIKKDSKSVKIFFKYLLLISLFPIGATIGGIFSSALNTYSVWICSLVLMFLLFLLKKSEK